MIKSITDVVRDQIESTFHQSIPNADVPAGRWSETFACIDNEGAIPRYLVFTRHPTHTRREFLGTCEVMVDRTAARITWIPDVELEGTFHDVARHTHPAELEALLGRLRESILQAAGVAPYPVPF